MLSGYVSIPGDSFANLGPLILDLSIFIWLCGNFERYIVGLWPPAYSWRKRLGVGWRP